MRTLLVVVTAASVLIALGAAASAQEDLEKGKSGAQIFAKDCALCHKTPQAVLKGGAPGEGFLRQHYTSGRESAAAVAAYLRGIRPPVSAERASKPKGSAKSGAKGEPKRAAKPKDANDTKPADQKPAVEAKPSAPKASEKKEQPAEKKQ